MGWKHGNMVRTWGTNSG